MKSTSSVPPADWAAYVSQMEAVLALELDDARRQELLTQFSRIAQMAQPLMDLPLDPRLEIAGVYHA
jgi:Asp-tRNA(Asn)/Glu-tRNA(Gln) amidotransferase C subunit